MPDRVYKKIEITGTSTTSLEDAVKSAVESCVQDRAQDALVRSRRNARPHR